VRRYDCVTSVLVYRYFYTVVSVQGLLLQLHNVSLAMTVESKDGGTGAFCQNCIVQCTCEVPA
jgi:hypothetical protein